MDHAGIKVYDGRINRRKPTPQRILWTNKQLPVCREGPRNRRLDVDTRRVLEHMLAKTKDKTIDGLVLGAIRRDGTLDIVITGEAFDNEVLAAGAAACILSVISDSHLGDIAEI